MGLRVAVATGNWSNPSTWNGGVLPSAGDIVASNNFTVTIDQNVDVDSLSNAVTNSTSLTAVMTSNTTPSGIVTASSILASTYDAWKAFDGNFSTSEWLTANNTPTGWLAYEFTSSKVVGKYTMNPPTASAPASIPRDWTFEGWDGSTWIILDTVTGNSGTSNVTRTFSNTTAYIKYRINITLNNGSSLYTGIRELYLYGPNDYGANSVAGGGFVLNGGLTVTLTNTTAGIVAGPTNCVTYSASTGTSTINGIIRGSTTTAGFAGILHSGAADLNINGDIQNGTLYSAGNNPGVRKTGTGTLSIVGNLYSIVDSNGNSPLYNTGAGTINITGNLYGHTANSFTSANGYTVAFTNSQVCTINITGNIYGGNTPANNGASPGLSNSAAATINITGNVYSDKNNSGIITTANSYLSIIGTLSSNFLNPSLNVYPAVSSSSSTAINLFTGPFISSTYGFVPYQCVRMHLIPSVGTYFEFRDETTNGAVSPGAIAPATRMVAPASIVDAPAPSNVRFGTIYANGSQTGTCKIPSTTTVAAGVGVDNTVGSAVLSPGDVWNALISTMTTPGSIGERLKNASTVQTTGEQLASIN